MIDRRKILAAIALYKYSVSRKKKIQKVTTSMTSAVIIVDVISYIVEPKSAGKVAVAMIK